MALATARSLIRSPPFLCWSKDLILGRINSGAWDYTLIEGIYYGRAVMSSNVYSVNVSLTVVSRTRFGRYLSEVRA